MKLPWVSREIYETERRRVDELTQLVATMRRDGFTASKPGKIIEREDVEVATRRRAEEQFVDRARSMLMEQTGIDVGTATREAERMRREATDLQPTSASDA